MNRRTFGDIVVTSHELATQAGLDLLAKGGNAVDAAIGANAVLGVVAPETCGIGGDLFALVHVPGESSPRTLNASGWAGSNIQTSHLPGPSIPTTDPASVTLPGCVKGWDWLVREMGSLPLSTVLAPAVGYAEDGFPASVELSRAFDSRAEQLQPQLAAKPFYRSGQMPQPGALIRRPDLAETLGRIATEGPTAFYEGTVAGSIVDAVGGFITLDDLAGFEPDWVAPLSLDVFGHTAWTIPPNSQGYLTLATARIFEQCAPPIDPADPDYVHLMVEAYRSVASRRDELLSDPTTAASTEELIGETALGDAAEAITLERAGTWPNPKPTIGGTTFLSVVDRSGVGISLIQSNFHGIGSGIGAGSSGFFLHNRGTGFSLEPGHRNEIHPGRRPAHTLAPSLWTRNGDLALILGTRGGDQQPQLLAQMAAHILHAGLSPAEAQNVPRWTTNEFGAGTTSSLSTESRFPPPVIESLRSRGHVVEEASAWEGGWGPVAAITIDQEGLRTGAADPRVATASTAVR